MSKLKCIIMVGPSGSGKTTYAKKHYSGFSFVSHDDYFVEKAEATGRRIEEIWSGDQLPAAYANCQQKFLELLRESAQIVVDNFNLRSRDRKFYMMLARTFGYTVNVVIMPNNPTLHSKRTQRGYSYEQIEKQSNQQKLEAGIYLYKNTTFKVAELHESYFAGGA